MDRYFSTEMPGVLFLRNVLLFSLAGLIPVLVLYVLLSPGFASALSAGGVSLSRFSRQLVTNGVPVVVVVNYVGFFLFALSNSQSGSGRDSAVFIAIDIVARLGVFVGLHSLIYVLSADWFGSFGGSRATALSVVAPTLARSALFENISGVYLYATLISAVPLYASSIRRSSTLRPIADMFPCSTGNAVMAIIIFGLLAVILTAIAAAVMSIQN